MTETRTEPWTTAELLLEFDRRKARSKQVEFGMSEVGGCRRRAGYRLNQVPPDNPGGSVQAAMGTAIHDAVDRVMDELAEEGVLAAGAKVNREVRYAGLLGHYDRFEVGTVIDTKSTSSRWIEHLMLHGPDLHDIWQVTLYGCALVKEGHKVTGIGLDYLARDTGQEWPWRGPFQPQLHARDALLWLRAVQETPLDMLPRDYMPDSAFCHGCPWAGQCWPYGLEGRGAAKVLLAQIEGAGAAAAELWEAKQEIKRLEAIAERARFALEAARPLQGQGVVDVGFDHNLRYGISGAKGTPTLRFTPKSSDGRTPAMGYEEGPP